MSVDRNTGEIVEPLTETEQSRLRVKEHAIERSAQEANDALRVIRDERLYRATHPTFEAYCHERWDLGRNYVNKQLAAAEVVAVLGTNVPIPEGQARELAPLRHEPERLREVWQAANDATDGKPTAAAIRAAREPEPTPEPETAAQEQQLADLIDDDTSVQDSRYMLALLKLLRPVASVHQFDPERVADLADDDVIASIDAAFENFAGWRNRVNAQRSSGLRVINGGTR